MADAPAARPALDLEDLLSAANALEGLAVRTPLLPLQALSRELGVPVRLKAEFLQPIGAFKIRGAWTAVSREEPVPLRTPETITSKFPSRSASCSSRRFPSTMRPA